MEGKARIKLKWDTHKEVIRILFPRVSKNCKEFSKERQTKIKENYNDDWSWWQSKGPKQCVCTQKGIMSIILSAW